MPLAKLQRGSFHMGGRVTRAPLSKELVRAKHLRQALDRGAPPAFIPPGTPNPVAQPSSPSWAPEPKNPATKNSKSPPEEILAVRRQYLEQLFQGSPDPLIVVDASFHTL